MHICYLCNEYPPGSHGGIGSMTRLLARSLVKRGHRATVIGLYAATSSRENDQGVDVVRVAATSIPRTGYVLNRRTLQRGLREVDAHDRIDVIEGAESAFALVGPSAPGKKIIRMHGGHRFFATTLGRQPAFWRSFLESRSFTRADALCAVSRHVAEQTSSLLHLSGRHIEIIPNPVDTERLVPIPGQEVPGRIVFVGTVTEKKGIRQLAHAMSIVCERVPEAHLVAAGPDTIDPETGRSYVARIKSELPSFIADRVQFLGRVPNENVGQFLAEGSVAAYPSHMEALPLAWLEAMALGKAIVASRTGPGPEVIEHERSGLLCDPRDPREIAAALIRLLTDERLRRNLAKEARKRAEQRFALSKVVLLNEAFYKKVIAGDPQV